MFPKYMTAHSYGQVKKCTLFYAVQENRKSTHLVPTPKYSQSRGHSVVKRKAKKDCAKNFIGRITFTEV